MLKKILTNQIEVIKCNVHRMNRQGEHGLLKLSPGIPQKGGSAMSTKLEVALSWLEKAAAIITIVVPATRKVVSLLKPDEPKEE